MQRTSITMPWALVLGALAVVPRLALAQAPAPAPSGVSGNSHKKIKMVTETLKDILQSVVNEEKQETTLFNKYMDWCTTEKGDLADDVKGSKTELANAKVLSEEQVASIDSLNLFITKSEKEIEETKDALAQAMALRNEESEKYAEEMQINTQSLRQIDSAIKHVGKVQQQGGFLQNGVMKKLQVNQPGESGYVLGVMKGLKDKLTKTRAIMESTEKEKVKMHDSFLATKGESLKSMSDKRVEKKITLTETNAKDANVKRKIGKLTEEVAKLYQAQEKTASNCLTSEQEWKVRQADRTKEKAALNEAVRFLTQDALEQLSLVQRPAQEQNDASVVFAPSLMQEASALKHALSAKEFYKAAGAALMGEDEDVDDHMKKDTFNGVKTVVQKLIGTHQDTQKEEEAKRRHCETELASTEDEKAATVDDLAAVAADIDKKSSEVDSLADEVKRMYETIDQVAKSLEAAGKVRKEQLALFTAGTKDRALAVKVLNQARDVLQKFYDKSKGNLLQAGQQPPSTSSRKSVESFGAVAMVQDIANDIAKEQKDAQMQEQEAVRVFEQLQKDSRSSTDDKHQDITDRVTAKAKLGVQINSLKETKETKANDLSSLNKQLAALHDSCDELVKFYDKRTKARSFEVSQLRDVMDILSGSSINARTGFVQDQDEAADAQEEESAE